MFDGPLMIWMNLPVIDIIHPENSKIVLCVKIKATRELKLNDGAENSLKILSRYF